MATIKGKWVFNTELVLFEAFGGTLNIDVVFSSAGNDCVLFIINADNNSVAYGFNDGESQVVYRNNAWIAEGFRTVDFGTTEQTVSDEFLTWLTANATPKAEPTPTDAVTIEYNGSVIASLKAGQSATVECANKLMEDNIAITVPEISVETVEEWDGSFTISGNTISFTIDGTTYQAEEGMTWEQWCESSYDTGGYYIAYGMVSAGGGKYIAKDNVFVSPTDIIVGNTSYTEKMEN